MADDLCFRVGERRAIRHAVYGDMDTPSNVTCTLYDPAGEVVVNAGAGSAEAKQAAPNGEFELSYIWDTRGRPAGDYTYLLAYTAGGETLMEPGEVALFPLSSTFDRWARRIAAWLVEERMAIDRQLSLRRVADVVLAARQEYEHAVPREVITDVALSAGLWQYALPSDWVAGISALLAIEFPVDDTQQVRHWVPERTWDLDEPQGVWRFASTIPTTGQTARLYYTTGHIIRDAAGAVTALDTIPEADFEAVSQYAAGLALLSLAARAPRMNQPQVGAELGNFRTKEQEYGARARAMMEAGKAAWGGRMVARRTEATWDYLPDHGRQIYPPWGPPSGAW